MLDESLSFLEEMKRFTSLAIKFTSFFMHNAGNAALFNSLHSHATLLLPRDQLVITASRFPESSSIH